MKGHAAAERPSPTISAGRKSPASAGSACAPGRAGMRRVARRLGRREAVACRLARGVAIGLASLVAGRAAASNPAASAPAISIAASANDAAGSTTSGVSNAAGANAGAARGPVKQAAMVASAARPPARVANLQPAAPGTNPLLRSTAPPKIPVNATAEVLPSVFPTIEVTPIDLASALRMVDVQNPQFLIAQQRVALAAAQRQLAATQILPTINLGTSYDGHTGVLQQSDGNILAVNRNALYIGAGAVAIAAGTVNIPGLMWSNNPSTVLYGYLQSQQIVNQQQYGSAAERNAMGLRVAMSYMDLLETEGRRAILLQIRSDAIELATITGSYAATGQGRDSDANRAATVLLDRNSQAVLAEGDTLRASARLAQLLNLDPSLRLHPTDNWVVPRALVPESLPLAELLTIAITRRPELAERQAAIRAAVLALDGARMLPFSPTLYLGMSAGAEAGGSNLVAQPVGSSFFARGESRFGSLFGRTDEDYVGYWTLKNIGLGNRALIDAAASRMRNADWQRLAVFEQVRLEVANAYVRARARLAQLITSQEAVGTATDSWLEDIARIRGNEGLPIEAVNSLRLLGRARLEYLESIIAYNRAQFELYVALGQPPADALARTEPPANPPGGGEPVMPLPPPPVEEQEPARR